MSGSHKPNNKGIGRVCPLRNTTICFHMKINPSLSSKRFNYFVIVYIPFPENQVVSFSDPFLKLDPRPCNLFLLHCICIMYSKHRIGRKAVKRLTQF
jgi:hypothetical protein